jgi:hypothetical protein
MGLKALAALALGLDSRATPSQPVQENLRNNEALSEMSLLREKLANLADAQGIDPGLIENLGEDDVFRCRDLPSSALSSYILALRDSGLRERGCVPADETARARCLRCGPVWVHPQVAAVAPAVNGWPLLLGCPWCHVRCQGLPIPRPNTMPKSRE